MSKLIVLDRDGVINEDRDDYIKTPDEWVAVPGALEAIARLTKAGYEIAVATNQSGVGRGLYTLDTMHAIHNKMLDQVTAAGGRIAAIFFCPHTPEAHCDCRKPKPGMLEDIAHRFNVDLTDVPCVGDSLRDLQAAESVGAQPILVLTGKGKQTKAAGGLPARTLIHADLAAAVKSIVS